MTARSHIKPKASAQADPLDLPPFLIIPQEVRNATRAAFVIERTQSATPDTAIARSIVEAAAAAKAAKLEQRRTRERNRILATRNDARPDAPWKRKTGIGQADYVRIRNELWQVGGI